MTEVLDDEVREDFPYRMKDLCELTGLPRQAIHFYIQQGLVPEGHKTGRNMAYYGEEHVERIRLVRKLQHERFLPLKAIRAVLAGEHEETFDPVQRRFIGEVRDRLHGALAPRAGERETVDAKEIMLRAGVDKKDFEALSALGVFATSPGPRGKTLVAKDDAWMIELWGDVRKAGFTRARGFGPETFAIYEEAISGMVDKEAKMLADRLSALPPEEAAAMVERALPLINTFLVRYHETKVRNFFAAL